MAAPDPLLRLIERFRAERTTFKGSSYNETQLRREFADPFFEFLGWDVTNSEGRSAALKDVVHEDSIRVEGSTRAPDYSFRLGGERKFFVETKRPSVNLDVMASPAYQLRRYGWSAKLPVSILTDFEEFAVYDCRQPPDPSQGARVARLFYFTVDEYEEQWDQIAGLFSREAVENGSLERYAQSINVPRGTSEVDGQFLDDIQSWRYGLAREISSSNPSLAIGLLNYAVQQIIDRIIFLRIAEDRGFEPHGQLREVAGTRDIYGGLVSLFRSADQKYNSGIFHFEEEAEVEEPPDQITPDLEIGNSALESLIERLYFPESPYEFSVMPARVLGQVYEQFLGKVISFGDGGEVQIEEKPEVKKAGGVYYTPEPIVRHIVEKTVGELVKGRSASQVAGSARIGKRKMPLAVLDPACGSGSFLIGAYEFLLHWYLEQYTSDDPSRHLRGRNPKLVEDGEGGWRLSTSERKQILLRHIYGVDIDPQAVEVTKLSLLLKVLEGESAESLYAQLSLISERALPDLSRNIKCGNTLVGSEMFWDQPLYPSIPELFQSVNTFNWEQEFKEILAGGGFDVVLGNPPYIDSELMSQVMPDVRSYCSDRYRAASGNWDIYCVFIQRALELCREGGIHGFIIPNKLASVDYASETRAFMAENAKLRTIRDYSKVPVFPVSVYPIVYTAEKSSTSSGHEVELERVEQGEDRVARVVYSSTRESRELIDGGAPWAIYGEDGDADFHSRLRRMPVKLGDIAEVFGAATVAEAYDLPPLLSDAGEREPQAGDLRFVNSGTIDRYEILWGERPTRYLKKQYPRPVVKAAALNRLPERRRIQGESPKLIIAGMTKVLETVADLEGSLLAGKSTTIVLSDVSLAVLAGVLNSDLVNFYYAREFGGNRLAGGYLRVGPPQLKTIPIPEILLHGDGGETARDIERLVLRIMILIREKRGAEPATTTRIQREIAELDREVSRKVAAMYGLTAEEAEEITRAVADEGA